MAKMDFYNITNMLVTALRSPPSPLPSRGFLLVGLARRSVGQRLFFCARGPTGLATTRPPLVSRPLCVRCHRGGVCAHVVCASRLHSGPSRPHARGRVPAKDQPGGATPEVTSGAGERVHSRGSARGAHESLTLEWFSHWWQFAWRRPPLVGLHAGAKALR